jgi:hypothetical protein
MEEPSNSIQESLKIKAAISQWISRAVDESTNVSDTKQLAPSVNGNGVFAITELLNDIGRDHWRYRFMPKSSKSNSITPLQKQAGLLQDAAPLACSLVIINVKNTMIAI